MAEENRNTFGQRVFMDELKEVRRRHVYSAYAQAAADPAFLEDMRSLTAAFEFAVGDGLSADRD
ncbi:MAG: hypothetical protein P8099_18940 [Gemmatimonadota bacterium]